MSDELLKTLSEYDLQNVTGGITVDDSLIDTLQRYIKEIGLELEKDLIVSLVNKGGCTLRNFVKTHTNNDSRCNMIPCF